MYPEYTVDFLRQRGHLVVKHRFAFVRLQRVQTQTAHLIEIRWARRGHRRRDRGRLAIDGHRRRRRRCRQRRCWWRRRRRRRRWRRRRRLFRLAVGAAVHCESILSSCGVRMYNVLIKLSSAQKRATSSLSSVQTVLAARTRIWPGRSRYYIIKTRSAGQSIFLFRKKNPSKTIRNAESRSLAGGRRAIRTINRVHTK